MQKPLPLVGRSWGGGTLQAIKCLKNMGSLEQTPISQPLPHKGEEEAYTFKISLWKSCCALVGSLKSRPIAVQDTKAPPPSGEGLGLEDASGNQAPQKYGFFEADPYLPASSPQGGRGGAHFQNQW
jgi:hypothetical protein